MNNPSLIIRPGRDYKPYRLKCRFKVDPWPRRSQLERAKVQIAEQFVEDMRKQGWVYNNSGFQMTGPFPAIMPITIRAPRVPSAKEMLSQVAMGARFLDDGGTEAGLMPTLDQSAWWEFEIAGVFIRPELMTEWPDLHEEERG